MNAPSSGVPSKDIAIILDKNDKGIYFQGMANWLGVLFGLHLTGVIYLITFLTTRAALRGKGIPWVLVLGKYMIYGALVGLGFRRFPAGAVLGGFTGGIYLSLLILYFLNQNREQKARE